MTENKIIEIWSCPECLNISETRSVKEIKIKFCAICGTEMIKRKNKNLNKWKI